MKIDKIIAGMLKWLGFSVLYPHQSSVYQTNLQSCLKCLNLMTLFIAFNNTVSSIQSDRCHHLDWPIQQLISMKAFLMHFPQPAFSRGSCPAAVATSQIHHTRSVVPFTFTCTHKFCHQHYDTSCILPPNPLYILRSKIAKPPKKKTASCWHTAVPTWISPQYYWLTTTSVIS